MSPGNEPRAVTTLTWFKLSHSVFKNLIILSLVLTICAINQSKVQKSIQIIKDKHLLLIIFHLSYSPKRVNTIYQVGLQRCPPVLGRPSDRKESDDYAEKTLDYAEICKINKVVPWAFFQGIKNILPITSVLCFMFDLLLPIMDRYFFVQRSFPQFTLLGLSEAQ